MFKIDEHELIIGAILWGFKFDETILKEKSLPIQYTFIGRFAVEEKYKHAYTYLVLKDNSTDKELEIPYKINGYISMSIFETDDYILARKRSRVIEIIRNVAVRPLLNEMYGGIAKKYLQLLEKENAELLI